MSLNAVELEILRTQLASVAEEMGEVLVRGAFSPNITDRRDCSTAVFDGEGRLVAQAEHIPVHLGAMPRAVDAVRELDPQPGDAVVVNDPYAGGTHLPDVTIVSPVGRDGRVAAYVASRAHHADVGGSTPGSMPADARDVHAEGLRIPPTTIRRDGDIVEDVLGVILANVRNPDERRADLRAQLGANERGRERVRDLFDAHGDRLATAFDAVIDYSRERVEAAVADLPDGRFSAEDALEGDGVTEEPIPIVASVTVDGSSLTVDFAGTSPQVAGSVNAPPAVAESAVYYVTRCVTDPSIPANQGCYDPVSVTIPEGSLLDPDPPAAVVGGNVETSQRVVDVVFAALAEAAPDTVPAAGQGTMNNLVVGGSAFTYYETVGGGAGAGPDGPGEHGVHVGMTNTRNTPVETLEAAYPLRVLEYGLRTGSGGAGEHDGGDGLVRSIRLERDATVSLLTDRRQSGPPGRSGGDPGEPGRNLVDGEPVGSKTTLDCPAGVVVRVETPGGGGFGESDPPED